MLKTVSPLPAALEQVVKRLEETDATAAETSTDRF
jgi:hypothetical protein